MLLFTFDDCLLFKYTDQGADYLSNKLCSRKSFQNVSKKCMAVFRGGGEKDLLILRKIHYLHLPLWKRLRTVLHSKRLFLLQKRGWDSARSLQMLEWRRRSEAFVNLHNSALISPCLLLVSQNSAHQQEISQKGPFKAVMDLFASVKI